MNSIADLKERYPDYIKRAFFLALLFHVFGFVALPHYSVSPYTPRVERPIQLEQLPPPLQNIYEPPPVPKPKVVVEVTEEEAEEETIEETEFTGWEKDIEPPQLETPDFVPYDTPPQPIRMVKPVYPSIARQAGLEGTVFLKLLIDVDGKVIDVKMIKSPHESLTLAAMEAAKQCLFSPALQRDKPVRVWAAQGFLFVLRE
ncbi:energy transducer TonB [candidate division TA06 bacterium]|nr:energy transducer TonB [candidate division TA06 bacterium]